SPPLFSKPPDSLPEYGGSPSKSLPLRRLRISRGCFLPQKQRKLVGLSEESGLNPQHLYDLVAPELAEVEVELREYCESSVSTISEDGPYVLKGGGQR